MEPGTKTEPGTMDQRAMTEKLRWLEKENLALWERIGKLQDDVNDLAAKVRPLL